MRFAFVLSLFASVAVGNELAVSVWSAPGAAFDETSYWLEAALVRGDALDAYLELRRELREAEAAARAKSDALEIGALLGGLGHPGREKFVSAYHRDYERAEALRARRRHEGTGRWLEKEMGVPTWVVPFRRAIPFSADVLAPLAWDATVWKDARIVIDFYVWRSHYGTSYVATATVPVPVDGNPRVPFEMDSPWVRVVGTVEAEGPACPEAMVGKKPADAH